MLNGKLMLRILSTEGHQFPVDYYLQPGDTLLAFDHEPRGLQINDMVSLNLQPEDESLVPSDWRFFLIYNYNTNRFVWPTSGSLVFESWVEPWTEDDKHLI